MKVWMRGRARVLHGLAGAVDVGLAGARQPAHHRPLDPLGDLRHGLRSRRREAIGKPASMMSTPISSRKSATSSFSSKVMVAPGHCSPSRRVVSKMKTRSVLAPLRGGCARCWGALGCWTWALSLSVARLMRAGMKLGLGLAVDPLSARPGSTGTVEAQGPIRSRLSRPSAARRRNDPGRRRAAMERCASRGLLGIGRAPCEAPFAAT